MLTNCRKLLKLQVLSVVGNTNVTPVRKYVKQHCEFVEWTVLGYSNNPVDDVARSRVLDLCD